MIAGVKIDRIEWKPDERGRLAELFRADDGSLPPFGQVHVTTVLPGAIKAWHRHRERTDVLAVVSGMARLGLFDDRQGSATYGELMELFLGDHQPLRVTIPPGVWFGLKGYGEREAVVVVLTDRPYDRKDPDEDRWHPVANEIPFDWDRRDR